MQNVSDITTMCHHVLNLSLTLINQINRTCQMSPYIGTHSYTYTVILIVIYYIYIQYLGTDLQGLS